MSRQYSHRSGTLLGHQSIYHGPNFLHLLLGSLIFAVMVATFLYFAVDWVWRLSVSIAWRRRKQRRLALKVAKPQQSQAQANTAQAIPEQANPVQTEAANTSDTADSKRN